MSDTFEAPLEFPLQRVLPQWIDYNGHMNVAWYVFAFDQCVDGLLDRIGLGPDYVSTRNCSSFTLEMHVNYLRELTEGDPLRITCQLLDFDDKRTHYFLTMHHADKGYVAATSEQISIHVDLGARRSGPYPAETMRRLERIRAAHAGLPRPELAGRSIGIRARME
jgi:acyl-CoA thioester hydrolase